MTDLRIERTCGYLRKAMMGLLAEKPIERITVAEVVRRAQVSKNSFYNHYGALSDLVQDCYLHEIVYFGPVHKRRRDYDTRAEAVTELLNVRARQLVTFKKFPNLARAVLLNVGVSPYFSHIEAAEEELNHEHLVTEYGEEEDGGPAPDTCIDYESCVHFVASGYYGMLRRWLAQGMVGSIETVVKQAVFYSLQVTAGMTGRAIEPEYRAAIEAWHFEE